MPNQLNFPDKLTTTPLQRPLRMSAKDLKLIRNENRQIIFGTTDRDVVELWIYNPNGTFAGHLNLGPTDQALTLTTLIDTSGPYEMLNLDMTRITQKVGLAPGRYAMVANFFRDEVGSEEGYKLYISDISDDRTEVQLYPVSPTAEVIRDIYEFITPSVSKQFAKGLIDQFFGMSLDALESEIVNQNKLDMQLDELIPGTTQRLRRGGLYDLYTAIINDLLDRTYHRTIVLLANDVKNYNVQQIEIERYIMDAFDFVVAQMQQSGQIPHLIQLI